MNPTFDDAIVGAGIIGLAHAFHLARSGRRVVVLERSARACGASVRNFGMLWPVGQPPGMMHEIALRSRSFWLEVLSASGLWHEQTGSLHLAYHDDEGRVLAEFVAGHDDYHCELLDAQQVARRAPYVKPTGLRGGMWSPSEICVDPRQVIGELPAWLHRQLGVQFEFDCAVARYDRPAIETSRGRYSAERLFVCSGDDFHTLYPAALSTAGMRRCKLQMLRTTSLAGQPRLGPMLAGGLTLRHYKNFRDCPSLAAVEARVARDAPWFDRFGIHVMVSQNGLGELILGDSHEYDAEIEPFDKVEIERLILEYLDTFFDAGRWQLAARWHGIYAKHPSESFFVARPADGVTCVTGLGGAGMTLSFGVAEHVLQNLAN